MKIENVKSIMANHHELLELVQSVVVSSPLEELARSDEVSAAGLQGGVVFLQDALQSTETPPLQTGLQHTFEKHLIRAVLGHHREEKWG